MFFREQFIFSNWLDIRVNVFTDSIMEQFIGFFLFFIYSQNWFMGFIQYYNSAWLSQNCCRILKQLLINFSMYYTFSTYGLLSWVSIIGVLLICSSTFVAFNKLQIILIEVRYLIFHKRIQVFIILNQQLPFLEYILNVDVKVKFMILYIFEVLIIFIVELPNSVVDRIQLVNSLHDFLLFASESIGDKLIMI